MAGILKFTYILLFIILNTIDVISSERNYSTRNTPSHYKLETKSAASASRIPTKITGKWQVGRVSRKQYEIINMLYRKTKTFLDTESTSASNSNRLTKYRGVFNKNNPHITLLPQNMLQETFKIVHPRPNDRPLTPSYIEFYYLDESDERVKRRNSITKSLLTGLQSDESKLVLLRPPFFLFRVNDATCKTTTLNYKTSFYNKDNFSPSHFIKASISEQRGKALLNKYVQDNYSPKTRNKLDMNNKTDKIRNKSLSTLIKDGFTTLAPRTSYDRIKFFEIYDSDTYKPRVLVEKINMINNNNIFQNVEKIYLDQVDHDTDNHDGNNETRYVKKHANYNFKENENLITKVVNIRNNASTVGTRKILAKLSQQARWLDFPFVAVYVYEPMQVRCDSAAISAHWLVATAVCLNRHHRSLNSDREGRSAFVAYCGSNWRLPGRIAYVKRSFIHPRFQAKHKSRRYLYNIGVIQVVNSMANTCSGWQPVSLMSHQFVAHRDGSYATAVGWGLDRYYTRYSSSDLPSYPLMLYEGLVYSDSCPGNTDYSKVKMQHGESAKNVYCLSLPAYKLEENDTVHGGLLLIGGKLIALYLQEERRLWGVQSAQYTGIWRLIPWLLDVAREVEDLDTFVLDL